MKTLLSLIVVALALTACGKNKDESASGQSTHSLPQSLQGLYDFTYQTSTPIFTWTAPSGSTESYTVYDCYNGYCGKLLQVACDPYRCSVKSPVSSSTSISENAVNGVSTFRVELCSLKSISYPSGYSLKLVTSGGKEILGREVTGQASKCGF